MDGQTPEVSNMPQQQPQQQQANVSQNVQGFASTTNLDAGGQVGPVQGCQQGNVPGMQGLGPAWFGAQWIPQQQTFMQQNSQARVPSYGCASMPGGPRSGDFPNLGVNPMSCQGNMPSGPVGASLGGLTPQAAQIQEVMAMLGSMSEGQLQTVQQHMQDRFVTMQQRRGVPEVFGDGLGRAADSSFVTPQPFDVLPGFGVQQSNHGNSQQLDVFAKSEKWLTPAPTPVGTWKTREEEVLGWAGYLDELSSWAAGGSLEFSVEIQHSSRWPGPIRWSALSGAQQARSRRLMSILKAAFHDNPRCVALVNTFSEGVALHGVGSSDRVAVAVNQQANGFELLRQLTLEFSLRSRSEALSLRTQIAGKSFVLAATQTSPSSLVSDTIRRIDYEAARFSRLLGTLPMQVDTTGLKLADSDMLVVLLKSLPETVKNYVLHHSGADNYESYRNAAMRWEEQQRLFSDFGTAGPSKRLSSLEGSVEHHSLDAELVDAVEGRCGKCGSRKHTAPGCTADMSKIRCFRCGKMGHISFNCPEGKEGKGSKGKGATFRSKGNSKGKGKKGKLNEVSEDWTDWTAESWDDDDYWWHDQWPESCDGQWGVSQTWWDDGSGWYCDGYGYTWQQGPVQSAEPSASHDNRSDVQKTGSVGSMIINPLLFDMTCETTGGLRFVHEHEVADMETENRLVVDCKDFESELADTGCVLAESCDSCTRESKEDELADMGCVLAGSCDSCTRESEKGNEMADMGCVLAESCDSCTHESEEKDELADTGCVLARGCDSCTCESEVVRSELADMGCVLAKGCDSCTHESEEVEAADMGCVLARGCDSCTHEPWFCGLKCGDEVGLGDSSNLETCFVNDPSRDLCATVPMKVVLVRAHDWFDDHSEVSVEQQIEPYLKFLRPLLSQVADNTDASWWLLDSGASTSVLAESNLSAFRSMLQDSEGLGGYRAANGSSVNMSGTAEIGVQMHMSGTSGDDWCWKKARLNVLVGSIRHNILSITSLADSGWRFTQGPKGFDLFHEKLGMHCLDVAYFANCPWVRLYPDVGSSSAYRSDLTVSDTRDFSVAAVSGGDDNELARHRRQGHIPFNPNCLECAKGRSVFQHRRDKGDRKEVSIQADFAFLNTTGEIVTDELPGSVKILVLTEMMSRCIGYVVVGEDVEAARRQIVVWLQHFGLTSKAVSIDVHTDSERAVGEIIGSSTGRYTFAIRRASPQQHRSIGSAERAVRELKESFSVLRADLNAQGLDVTFSHENLVDVLTYLALCNNHFSTSRGSDRSPLEMVSGRKLSKPVSTLFGAQVLAEIPDSIRQHSPLSTRNVECTFIHMGLERGPVVQGLIRVDGKAELMRFVARNIRAISPLRWDLNSGQGVLTQFDTGTVGSRPQIVNDSGTAPADMSQLPPEELRKLKGQSLPAPSQPKLVLPESSSVKKKPGELRLAPAVPLARANVVVTPQEVPAEPSRVSVTPSPTSPADTADVAIGSPESSERTSPDVSRFEPTRRCPACESGMEAPGIRHNKECRKRFAEFEEQRRKERRVEPALSQESPVVVPQVQVPVEEVDDEELVPTPESARRQPETQVEYTRRFKRKAETDREQLEREIREDSEELLQTNMDFDWFWVGSGEPVLVASLGTLEGPASFAPATSPEMFSGSLDSVCFKRGNEHDFVKMRLGGQDVLVWKPDSIIDDQSLQELDLEQGFKGMQEEVRNLEHCKTGRIITQSELDDMKKAVPNLRLIQSRWVAAYKSSERVRTRIVAKDFNRGSSARSLGFSSPTPSIESVHLVLAMAATRKMLLRALDVSHAFMHSPLGTGVHVVLKMPLSISFPPGEATYYLLEKALNGLRDASLAWLQLLTFTVEHVGLWSDSLEPCVYGGQIVKDGHEIGFCLCVVYVDDILLLSTTKEAEEHVVATLSSVEEGGSLTFIGRVIKRERDSSEITLGVDPHYLDSTFLDYGVTRGSENVPDISGHLEKTLTDSNFQKPLSDEAYSRFRKALGKLLWLSQVRHDLKTWMSVLGTQQAKPMHGTEQALKAVLRFLYVDMHACLCLPSRDETIMSQVDDTQLRSVHLHSFSDASHAPYRFNNRKEIRLHWLREQMREGLLKLRHRSGVENPADLFTKCLSAKAFYKHRYALGIVVPDGLTAELAELRVLQLRLWNCVVRNIRT